MLHMHMRFNDDIFARCLVIMKNVIISFIKEYRGPTLRPPCDDIDDVIIMKILLFGIIWDDLFISEVKLKLCLIFHNFQNGRYFELATNFFTDFFFIDDVIIMKILLFCTIWDDLFISEVKLKLCLIFQNFQNDRYFELATNFFTGSYTGSWIYQKDSHEHFRHFELLIDALAQILTEICQFQNLTYFVTWWRHRWRHECVKHNLHN